MQDPRIEALKALLAEGGQETAVSGEMREQIIGSLNPAQKKLLEDALHDGNLAKKLLHTPQAAALLEMLGKQDGGDGNGA